MSDAGARSADRSLRVMLGITSPQSFKLLTGFPDYLLEQGMDVHIVASGAPALEVDPRLVLHMVEMRREPSPARDVLALLAWVRLLRSTKPDLVVAGTPKAGLLGMIAARLVGVPARIYLLRGLRLETERGPRRRLLWFMEWLAARSATKVQAVSSSLREEFVGLGLASPAKVVVLGRGSSNGVDLRKSEMPLVLSQLGLSAATPVLGFVGRISRDKGVELLLASVARLRAKGERVQLLLIGGEEPEGALSAALQSVGLSDDEVVWVGAVNDVRPYYRCMDILCLPTRREGFPNVVLEAAVESVPVVATRATGVVDAVVDQQTGWLVPIDDVDSLTDRIAQLLEDPAEVQRAGVAARDHVISNFDRTTVWRSSFDFYLREVGARRGGRRARRGAKWGAIKR